MPSGADRKASTMRPRSQRVVVVKTGVGRLARVVLGIGSLPAEAHHGRRGQSSQRAVRGRQIVAPTSIMACVQSAGRPG